MSYRSKSNKSYAPNVGDKEDFNMMQLYLMRVDSRSNDRDIALNSGDLEVLKNTTLSLLLNVLPRCEQIGIDPDKLKELQEKILDKTKMIESISMDLLKKSYRKYIRDFYQLNLELERYKFKAGMVFPEKDKRSLEDIRKADY